MGRTAKRRVGVPRIWRTLGQEFRTLRQFVQVLVSARTLGQFATTRRQDLGRVPGVLWAPHRVAGRSNANPPRPANRRAEATLAEVTMLIIERRTAGVLAALATTAAMVILGNVRDGVDEGATAPPAESAQSAGPDATQDRLLAAAQPVEHRLR
jgi:hypothetical protein